MKNKDRLVIYSVITSIFLFFISLFLLKTPIQLSILLFILPLFLPVYFMVKEYRENEELEDNFVPFLIDLSQYLESGLTIKDALASVLNNNYGKKLNREIRKMLSEMEFGLTFIEAFSRMADRISSPRIKKMIYSIIETERYGGDIKRLLKTMSRTLDDIIYIKKNRISKLRNFAVVFYLIFVMLLITIYMIEIMVLKMSLFEETTNIIKSFNQVALILLILNAIFTGLVIGKVSSGKVTSGIPHSLVLIVITTLFYLVL